MLLGAVAGTPAFGLLQRTAPSQTAPELPEAAHYGVYTLDIPPRLLNFDAVLCGIAILVDTSIAVLAAQGAVMRPRRAMGRCFQHSGVQVGYATPFRSGVATHP